MWVGKDHQCQSFCSKGVGERVRSWGRERGRGGDPDPHPAGLHCLLFQEVLQWVLVLTYYFNLMDVWNAIAPQHLTQKCKATISALFAEGGWDYFEFWSHDNQKRFEMESGTEKETKTEHVWVFAGVLSRSWAEERRGANVREPMLETPASLVFLQSKSIKLCWASWHPFQVMGHETSLTVFAAGAISVFQKSCKPASWTWMSFTKMAVLFTSPPCVGVSHQVTQAVLQFSIFCLNLITNIAKGKHISFYSASRGKARSRKGTEMKDITTCGTHPPADEQTIPRIARKYFQHCSRAGQASLLPHTLWSYNCGCDGHPKETPNAAGRRFQTFHGVILPEWLHCVHWGSARQGAAGLPWQLSSCVHAEIELSLHRGLAHCSTLTCKGADFKAQSLVTMSSLLTPWGLQLSHSATCISLPLLVWGKGEGTRNWYHHLNHCPQRAALVCECLCPLWGVGIRLRSGKLSGIICLRKVHLREI